METVVQSDILVNKAKQTVWELLANLETVADYDTEILRAFYLSETREGLGASRQCDLPNGEFLRERVIDWQVGTSYAITVYEDNLTNYPCINQIASFNVEELSSEQCRVWMSYEYKLKQDKENDHEAIKMMATELVTQILNGLKTLAETGQSAKSSPKASE